MLILTWERAGGRASQHAPDLHLHFAYGECATGMQTGGNLTHPSGESRDLPEATHSLLSRDTVCLLDTDCSSGTTGWDGGRIDTRGLLLPSSLTFFEIWQIREVAFPDQVCKGEEERPGPKRQSSISCWWSFTIHRLAIGRQTGYTTGPTRWCMPHRLDAALLWEVT